MNWEEFLWEVRSGSGVESTDDVRAGARAAMAVLAERVGGDEAAQFAAQLPPELGDAFQAGQAEPFRYDEFLARAAERADLDESTVERVARATMAVARRAAGDGPFGDVVSRLSDDYKPILAESGGLEFRRSPASGPGPRS